MLNFDIAYCISIDNWRASLMAQMVKNLPAMQEIQVHSLGWEDPSEKEMSVKYLQNSGFLQ